MSRPRKSEQERIEDAFYDMDQESQASMLRTLQTLHRLKSRQSSDKETATSESVAVVKTLLDGLERPQ